MLKDRYLGKIDELKDGLKYVDIQLSRNKIEVNVVAADPLIENRFGIRYFLDVYTKNNYSGNWELLITLEGSEVPPYVKDGAMVYEGAYFPIEKYLDSLLSYALPTQKQDFCSLSNSILSNYRIVKRIANNGIELVNEVLTENFVLKAGIDEIDFSAWKKELFKNTDTGLAGKFLTWDRNENGRPIRKNEEVFLYFLDNLSNSIEELAVRLAVQFSDESIEVRTVKRFFLLNGVNVYCIPVSIAALDIGEDESRYVKSYGVWLSDSSSMKRVSEVMYYIIDSSYERNERQILFSSNLGGFDTLVLRGSGTENLGVRRDESERYVPFSTDATYSEKIVNEITGERELTVSVGVMNKKEIAKMAELVFAREIYFVSEKGRLPLKLIDDSYIPLDDDEWVSGREFRFQYTNKQYNFSMLAPAPAAIIRATGWRGFGAAICQQNKNGVFTGYGLYQKIQRYYLDTNEAVIPLEIKTNTIGTAGYIGLVLVDSCAITPYLNVKIEADCQFMKQGCMQPLLGNYPKILIEAGVYGSTISQADADAKAQAAFDALNTQEYANEHGVCSIGNYLNTKIEREGSFVRSNCELGYDGTKATIIIDAGMFSSNLSQADADAKAQAAFDALNTQEYANQHGRCELHRYFNAEIKKMGSFKRSNCGTGYLGNYAEIVISAGMFSSIISQADADAKAQAAFDALNTQEYANQHGVCSIASNGFRVTYFNYNDAPIWSSGPVTLGTQKYTELLSGSINIVDIGGSSRFANARNARWSTNNAALQIDGLLIAPKSGDIRFMAAADDGYRVWIDDTLILDSWLYDGGISKTKMGVAQNLVAGQLYKIKVQYYNFDGYGEFKLQWDLGNGFSDIPSDKLIVNE